jgi:putative transposase
MARLPRFALPGQPQHVIQRGNNRSAMFADTADYERFRHDLATACERYGCVVHAYVLMTNHVHLLMTGSIAGTVGRAMQSLGRRYVGYYNRKHGRTGTLWEGRYRSAPIDSERYLFTCCRYIEQNPVRAGMVDHPRHYRWSSFHANALGALDPLVTPHGRYVALGRDGAERLTAYREICAVPFDGPTLDEVRTAIRGNWALGGTRFRDELTSATGRRAGPLNKGGRRPPHRWGELGSF